MIVGVEAAVLYQNISFWVETNRANNKNFFEGKYWTYNSARAFSELFPFWSSSKIVRLLIKLEEKKLIESGEFNQRGYDRTKWYTTICQNRQMDLPKSANGFARIGRAIPDINTDKKPDSNTRKEKDVKKSYTKDDIKLTDSLFLTVAKLFPNHKKLASRKAKDSDYMEMNKLHRIDGYSYKDIETVLKWLYSGYKPNPNSDFDWKDVIKSVGNLRKHFVNLSQQYEKDKKTGRYRPINYDSRPPEKRKPAAKPIERDEPKISPEEAEKNKLILALVRAKKVHFSEMKSLKSKTADELRDMLNPV